ncbi:hypothetical protein CEV34_0206 [Brucella pseudogrignonensis]|uniref:Uncharacterized protein n=1 Tax=Brucella pseudogrignonensis TaxID=419475 RepID=A0A256GV65_9HYPH|nr:hypothetical protein CEV34_0206 [Brucella pseudogrignonensis]
MMKCAAFPPFFTVAFHLRQDYISGNSVVKDAAYKSCTTRL